MTRRFPYRTGALRAVALAVVAAVFLGCNPAPSGPSPSTVLVGGRVHAGPVCPVARPNDPACADRPVVGAVLVVQRPDGSEAGRATTGPDGTFTVSLAPGSYVLVPQPVQGLLGTAGQQSFNVPAGGAAPPALDVGYDTGIR